MIISPSHHEKNIRNNFLYSKIYLQEKNFPFLESNALISIYYGFIRNLVAKNVKPESIILGVPSGSGKNTLPAHLGNFISKDVPGSKYIDSNGLFFSESLNPSKSKLNFEDRAQDPIFFKETSSNAIDFIKTISNNKSIYLVDDWFATGESSINFKRELEKNGISVEGIIPLIVNTKSLADFQDIKNINSKLTKSNNAPEDITKAVISNFDGYSKNKVNKFLFEISLSQNPSKLIDSIFTLQEKYLDRKLLYLQKNAK